MTNVNCSYTHTNGTDVSLICTSGSSNCCQATDYKFCSSTECSIDSASSFALTTIVFWAILGGLLFLSFTIMVTVYVVCYSRNPGKCLSRNPIEELLEIPVQKEENDNGGQNNHNPKASSESKRTDTVNESVHKLNGNRFKHIQETQRICVTPQRCSSEESFSASLDRVRLVANDRRRTKIARLKPTESSSSPSISCRNLHVTPIGLSQ